MSAGKRLAATNPTYVAWVQDSCIFFADLWKHVALVAQQPVHVPYETKVVLVPRSLTYGLPPFFYQFENLVLYTRRVHRRTFREAANELIEKLFGAYLKVESVAAVFDANVEELCDGELCGDESGAAHRTLSARRATFWFRWLT
jgi:hypothetical protein